MIHDLILGLGLVVIGFLAIIFLVGVMGRLASKLTKYEK